MLEVILVLSFALTVLPTSTPAPSGTCCLYVVNCVFSLLQSCQQTFDYKFKITGISSG